MLRSALLSCVVAFLAARAEAFFIGWISQSSTVNGPSGPVAVLDLYALFTDEDELLVSIRNATITSSNVVFLHDDALGGSWRPQVSNNFGEFDSFVMLGGWPGAGNSTIFPTGPSPDQAPFPAGLTWTDGDEVPFQGIPMPLPFINVYGVQIGRFVTSAVAENPCAPTSKSFVLSCIIEYQPFFGGPVVEFSLPHLAVFAPSVALGDLNLDGVVDGADLGALLGSWGPCAGCPADLDGSGAVDGADLGLLLATWPYCF